MSSFSSINGFLSALRRLDNDFFTISNDIVSVSDALSELEEGGQPSVNVFFASTTATVSDLLKVIIDGELALNSSGVLEFIDRFSGITSDLSTLYLFGNDIVKASQHYSSGSNKFPARLFDAAFHGAEFAGSVAQTIFEADAAVTAALFTLVVAFPPIAPFTFALSPAVLSFTVAIGGAATVIDASVGLLKQAHFITWNDPQLYSATGDYTLNVGENVGANLTVYGGPTTPTTYSAWSAGLGTGYQAMPGSDVTDNFKGSGTFVGNSGADTFILNGAILAEGKSGAGNTYIIPTGGAGTIGLR